MAFNPGSTWTSPSRGRPKTRSFSMANTPSTDDHLEFIIRVYPDGHFSGLLESKLKPGDALQVKGHTAYSPLGTTRIGTSSSSAAAPEWLRSCACCDRWPKMAINERPSTTTGPGVSKTLLPGGDRRARPPASRFPLRASPVRPGRTRGMGRRGRDDHRCGQGW